MKRGILVGTCLLAMMGSARGGKIVKIASGMAKGDFARVSVSADADQADEIELTILADPDQKVDVSWYISCHTEDYSDSGSKSKDFTAETPIQRTIPFPISNPEKCSVDASGFLNEKGRVRLVLTKN